MLRRLACCVVTILASLPSVTAGEIGDSLLAHMEQIYRSPLDTSKTFLLAGVTLAHQDITLTVDSGRMAFLQLPVLGAISPVTGVYIEGKLRFTFTPAPSVEKGQLKRFFDKGTLDCDAGEAILFCRSDLIASIQTVGIAQFSRNDVKRIGKQLESLEDYDKFHGFRFNILEASLTSAAQPFLSAFVQPRNGDQLQYIFNPLEREQVQLRKSYRRPGVDVMELICSYATDSRDGSGGFDGIPRDRCHVSHYTLNGLIDQKGKYFGSAALTLVADSTVNVLEFYLHESLNVDSILDAAGSKLAFHRYKNVFKYWYPQLYVYPDSVMTPGTTTLTAYYSGDIAERWNGEFIVDAGATWYPRTGGSLWATFDMTFRTFKDYAFVACGTKTGERESLDTLITTWTVTEPTHNVSFAIGNMKKYEFSDSLAGNVDIYVNSEIRKSDRKMGKAVSDDLIKALRFYKERFGNIPYSRISATEILDQHGEAFAGFLHLGYNTFTATKEFGVEATFRAHEVAHQWWGVGACYDSYHDQWLSEGFATYCALMYIQATEGNDMFVSKLVAGRKEINGVRNYIFGSGTESGPIILGYRTSSTKTQGDYQLIIYKKAALVLHMLRTMMLDLKTFSEDRFFDMMREFYETYRGKNASTADFRRMVEKHVGEDMGWFFDQWIYGTDIPTIDFSYSLEPGENNSFTARCRMVTKDVSEDFFTYIPVAIQFDDMKVYARVALDKPVTEFTLTLPRKPKEIKLNPGEAVLANINQ